MEAGRPWSALGANQIRKREAGKRRKGGQEMSVCSLWQGCGITLEGCIVRFDFTPSLAPLSPSHTHLQFTQHPQPFNLSPSLPIPPFLPRPLLLFAPPPLPCYPSPPHPNALARCGECGHAAVALQRRHHSIKPRLVPNALECLVNGRRVRLACAGAERIEVVVKDGLSLRVGQIAHGPHGVALQRRQRLFPCRLPFQQRGKPSGGKG